MKIAGMRINALFILGIIILVLCAMFGCGGDSRMTTDSQGIELPAGLLDELPTIPLPETPAHSVSVGAQVVKLGDEYDSKSDGATIAGTNLTLPAGPGAIEWGIWGFNIGANPAATVEDLSYVIQEAIVDPLWVGVANYTTNQWEWYDYTSVTTIDLTGGDNYVSPLNNVFSTVVTFDSVTYNVVTGTLNYDDGLTTYSLSGSILDDGGFPITGAGVNVMPGDINVPADGSGDYTVPDLLPGSYTVTPTANSYDFAPPSSPVDIVDADVTGVDFVGTLASGDYSISGSILDNLGAPVPDASVRVTPGNFDINADPAGDYIVPNLPPQSYVVTPQAPGYTFVPLASNVDIVDADVTDVDFLGTPDTGGYSISGSILDNLGAPISGSQVRVLPLDLVAPADGAGNYTVSGLLPAMYTVIPEATGYGFVPELTDVEIVDADVTGIDFVGTMAGDFYSISGHVFDDMGQIIPGANVNVVPGDHNVVPDGVGGAYTVPNLVDDAYTVTPTADGYSFVPPSLVVIISGGDQSGVDFLGTGGGGEVTYYDDIRPFYEANCFSCHFYESTEVNLESYEDAFNFAAPARDKVLEDHEAPEPGTYSGEDKDMMNDWVLGGAPLGINAATYDDDAFPDVFDTVCTVCHDSSNVMGRQGAPLDVNYDTYTFATGARPTGENIAKRGNIRAQADEMPPAPMSPLSAAQKATLQKWIDSGWPEMH